MPKLVTHGASLKCNQGTAPCSLAVPPDDKIDSDSAPIATIDHHAPSTNIASFGMCNSSTNPSVISATSAASGVHTPMPCPRALAHPRVLYARI